MAEIFYDDSADLSVIQRRHVAVLGYGSQGHAHALSLRDSGVDVRVGLPEGSKSREKAANEGLRVITPAEACEEVGPDHGPGPGPPAARSCTPRRSRPSLVEGDALFFAHGLNIRYDLITPPAGVDVCMVAPKAPGHLVRRQFAQGRGVPVLVCVERDATGQRLAADPGLRQGHRRHPRGRAEEHVHRGDRDRPVRRADGALRRRRRADQGGLRDPGRGRLPAGVRLLRVPARDEADRGPDVRGRHLQDVLVGVRHRRVRRLHPRARG